MSKPQNIKLIDTKKSHRTKAEIEARSECEPGGCSAKLKMPSDLDDRAKAEWRRIVRLYKELDVEILNDLHIAILKAYCEAVSRYDVALAEIEKNGQYYTDDKGIRRTNPALKDMNEQAALMKNLADQLCLSPAGQAKIGIDRAKKKMEEDPMAAFFARHNA